MTGQFKVTDDIRIEAFGPDEAEHPLVFLIFDDFPEDQSVPIFANEIKALVAALTDAAVWLAEQVVAE